MARHHLAGTIGEAADAASGVTGVAWTSKIQPIRVLGRCGGYTSDLADAMPWAADIAAAGVPANVTPVRVLNLTLDGNGSCGTIFQNAINDGVARGAVVVVSAANSNVNAANNSPANYHDVITVATSTRTGARTSCSNFGQKVALAASGGSNLSTPNSGTTPPAAPGYASKSFHSMAAPHVAGVVSLMLSPNAGMTPAQVLTIFEAGSRAFPIGTGAERTTAWCGAGIVDAAAALPVEAPSRSARHSPTEPEIASVNHALPSSGAVIGGRPTSALPTAWPESTVLWCRMPTTIRLNAPRP